jgi:hypothetical protein
MHTRLIAPRNACTLFYLTFSKATVDLFECLVRSILSNLFGYKHDSKLCNEQLNDISEVFSMYIRDYNFHYFELKSTSYEYKQVPLDWTLGKVFMHPVLKRCA